MVPIIVETENFVRGFISTVLYKNQGLLIHMSRSKYNTIQESGFVDPYVTVH